MNRKTSGIYIGVQPRPLWLFDKAPNRWRPACSGTDRNCACDDDIEYITNAYFDIDVHSTERTKGHPATEEELNHTLHAAQGLCRADGLAMISTICCSGNGHYVLAPVVPILVYSNEITMKFKEFCRRLVDSVAGKISSVRFDPVFNASRVMRIMGTMNRKGRTVPERPYRLAHFVTEPVYTRSMALHHMIMNTEMNEPYNTTRYLSEGIRCDLRKLENCKFIQWCRSYPEQVSEPLWWAMITNLVYLEGGIQLIHEISRLDKQRYDFSDTERVIRRVINSGYRPVLCRTLIYESMACTGNERFQCSIINKCRARAPMYMATLRTVYQR